MFPIKYTNEIHKKHPTVPRICSNNNDVKTAFEAEQHIAVVNNRSMIKLCLIGLFYTDLMGT